MKLSDYVADFLAEKGIKYTFGITGGTIVHIFDSIDKNLDIQNICVQHEQAAAIAADAYARVTGDIGVSIATSGPGATNLITGIACSYFDSIPTLVITGQVPCSQLDPNSETRQIGFQETNMSLILKPLTKHAVLIQDPKKIKYELEKAYYLAKSGRPGPVLIDLPDDIQRAEINPEELESFSPPEKQKNLLEIEQQVDRAIELINNSQRPIIISGGGVKLSKSSEKLKEIIERLNIPVALTWATMDTLSHEHPLSVRDFGVTANRPGNFAVQNADLIIAMGTRLDTHQTGSNLAEFAREAKKIVVDIDKAELEKYEKRGMPVDVLINADVRDFLEVFERKITKINSNDISEWRNKIKEWKQKYPVCLPEYFTQPQQINPYVFLDILSNEAASSDIIIPEAGCNVTWSFQGWKIKEGQKLFTSYNHSPMGYGVPAAIGASFANNQNPVIAIVGDGGIQMNIQELATIIAHELPIKIFLMNNRCYGMMQQTQETWLDSRFVGSCCKSGLPKVDLVKIAQAYGLKTIKIENHSELKFKLREVLDYNGPVLCDVRIHQRARIFPKLSFGKPIEDPEPPLSREEFYKNMIVKPLD